MTETQILTECCYIKVLPLPGAGPRDGSQNAG
jgi:hypothetical protein